MRRAGRLVAAALAVTVIVVAVLFGLLQTPFGRAWFARTVAEAASTPEFSLKIAGLEGLVPFRITAARIELGDATGTWATLKGFRLDLSAADLLRGRAHLTALSVREVDMARWAGGKSTPQPPQQLIGDLHLPIPLVIDRLAIGRLVLAPPVLGERVVATLAGRAASVGKEIGAKLDLHRIDNTPGKLTLDLAITGQTLTLRLDADEPSGLVLDRLLGRTDHLPLAVSLNGVGPVSDWNGRLVASAGKKAEVAAALSVAVSRTKRLVVKGSAAVAPLLPAQLAPLAGKRVRFAVRLTAGTGIAVDSLSIATAAGALSGRGSYRNPQSPVSAEVQIDLPDLARFSAFLGRPLAGRAKVRATLSGTGIRPRFRAEIDGAALRVGGTGAERARLHLSAAATGDIADPKTRLDIAAGGRIAGLTTPPGVILPPALGRDIDWSLAATASPAAGTLTVNHLSAKGAGLDLAGTGTVAKGGRRLAGTATLKIADLRAFSGLLGRPIAGAVTLDARARREGADGFAAHLAGSARGLRTGIAGIDALIGKTVRISGSAERPGGSPRLAGQLTLAGAEATADAKGTFETASRHLAATLRLELPRLATLGPALGAKGLAGRASARATVSGPLDRLQAEGEIAGDALAFAGARLDRLRIKGEIADLAAPEARIDGSFRTGGLDGTLALTAALKGGATLAVPRLRLAAAGSSIEGKLRIALDSGHIDGTLSGKAPDLARWSRLAGRPLAGRLDFSADFAAAKGQSIELRANGGNLAAGKGIALDRLVLKAHLADLHGKPTGGGKLAIDGLALPSGAVSSATFAFDSARPGHFAFRGEAKGRPLNVALAGKLDIATNRIDLGIDQFSGSMRGARFRLARRLTVSKHGPDLGFSDLDLQIGRGRGQVSGSGSVRGERLALALRGTDLPLGAGAQLAGDHKLRGRLGFSLKLDGTLRAPQGHLTLDGRELRFGLARAGRLSQLGLAASADWNGREIDAKGRVTGLPGDRVAFDARLPLRLTPAPLALTVPRNGPISVRLDGSGELSHLSPLLPLDEDRLSGRYKINAAASGTMAAPQASGHLTLTGGRYENFVTGAVLTGIRADLTGNRDRFTLSAFSAGDGASGRLKASGNVVLSDPLGPSAQLSATLDKFRIAARDEAVATASGKIAVTGPLDAPAVSARLTIDKAALQLPASLPPSVTKLDVVVVNGANHPLPAAQRSQPALPAKLDIEIAMPGQVFVRGHGLDSEWRGRLAITGTSAAPKITGTLREVRGTFDLLGKTFRLESGSTITFTGDAKPDPALNITAAASAADITARVQIGGFASAPTIKLSSTPALPQDEILSRVLFNQATGQLTVGEGIQLAQAAADLATGGGPGLLDRLRGGLGLDRLSFGSGAGGPASSTLNPELRTGTNTTTGGTTLSGGKYVAPGVYVGVTQGTSTQSSKATVQVEILPHFNVETDVGESGGTGIGLNYKYDY